MANPSIEEQTRQNPEFSLGERLARLEAIFEAREGKDVATAELFNEKINSLRNELGAINSAQKEAVSKAEAATDRRLELIGAQIETDRGLANTRLQALERGEAGQEGVRHYKGGQVAWIGAAAALATVVIYTVILLHP